MPITLLAADALTGPTPISFFAPVEAVVPELEDAAIEFTYDMEPVADAVVPELGTVTITATDDFAPVAEAVVPDLLDFLNYCFYNSSYKARYLGGKKASAFWSQRGIDFLDWMRKEACKALAESKRFDQPANIRELAEFARPFVSIGNQSGEGWFLTGEMIELIHGGVMNIVCTQPFACLPNHVVGKGVIKTLRAHFPGANIIAVDYDPGASEVNQLNRIKLMLSTAQKNLASQQGGKDL